MSPLFQRVVSAYRSGFYIDGNVFLIQLMDDFIRLAQANQHIRRAPAVSLIISDITRAQAFGDYLHIADLLQYEIWPIVNGQVIFSEPIENQEPRLFLKSDPLHQAIIKEVG